MDRSAEWPPWGGWAALAAALAGCSHPAVLPPKGQSAFRVVPPPIILMPATEVRPHEGDTHDIYLEAVPDGPLVNPVYPAAALAGHAGWVIVGVRITIADDGRVTDVRPSPAVISTPTPYEEQFMAAIEAAVRRWHFTPGRFRTEVAKEGPGGLYWKPVGERTTESFTDLAFTFTAMGEVVLGGRR